MPTKKKNPLTSDTIDFAKLYTPTSKQMEAHLRPEKYILFGGAMRGGKSVHKDTIVLSKTKGYIPICEVEKNDFILSMTEKGKLEYSKVLNTNYIPNELTYKITTRTEQSIICSYTHPVLTQRGWVRYNELILDDKIAISRQHPSPDLEFSEIIYDGWCLAIIAHLIGNGCVTEGTPVLSCFNLKQIQFLLRILPENFKFTEYSEGKFGISDPKNPGKNLLTDILRELGLYGKTSYYKFIPHQYKNLCKEDSAFFLNCLYGTDGWACLGEKRCEVGYTSTSKQLVLDVKDMLLKFGIVGMFSQKKTPSDFGVAYTISIKRANDIKKFIKEIGIYGKETGTGACLARLENTKCSFNGDTIPKIMFKHLLDGMSCSKGTKQYKLKKNFRYLGQPTVQRQYLQEAIKDYPEFGVLYDVAHSDLYWDDIRSLESLNKEENLYDLEIEGNHNFVANNIIVHNSAWLVAEALQLSFDYPDNRGFLCRHEAATFMKTTYLELMKFLPPEAIANHNQSRQFIELINGSRIDYGGLKATEGAKSLERLKSMTLGWFGIDEATETNEELFKLLMTRLSLKTPRSPNMHFRGMITANPEPGWVKQRFVDQQQDNYYFVSALPKDNPHNPDTYESELRRELEKDPEWVARYLDGDWEVDSLTPFPLVFPLSNIRSAVDLGRLDKWEIIEDTKDKDKDEEWNPEVDGEQTAEAKEKKKKDNTTVVLAADIGAGTGGDESVLVSRINGFCKLEFRSKKMNTMAFAGKIGQTAIELEAEGFSVDRIVVDGTGLGIGVCDRLDEDEYLRKRLERFIAGGKPRNKERLKLNKHELLTRDYFNAKAEAYWEFREAMQEGKVSLPDDTDLLSQLQPIRYRLRSDRQIQIESKDDLKRRGLKSPDIAEAFIMLYARGSRVASDLNIFYI